MKVLISIDDTDNVLQQGASVLLVTPLSREKSEAVWQTVHRKQLRGY